MIPAMILGKYGETTQKSHISRQPFEHAKSPQDEFTLRVALGAVVAVILAVLVAVAGCSVPAQAPGRYHVIPGMEGSKIGPILLDTATGQSWTLCFTSAPNPERFEEEFGFAEPTGQQIKWCRIEGL